MSDKKIIDYIHCYLGSLIFEKITNEVWDSFEIEHAGGLDGFMSALYNINLQSKSATGTKGRLLVAKFMKGSNEFRETSKAYIQFANEVFVYEKIIPEYERILKAAGSSVSSKDWVPRCIVAKFGFVEGLSATPLERESVLVLEHLKPMGYKLGPRLYLNRDHLLRMCAPIGQFHAMSYVLRLTDLPLFYRLKDGIKVLPFINDNDPDDAKNNLYRVLYRVGFDRFFDFFDRKIDSNSFDKKKPDELKLIERLRNLREKYFAEPTRLLERLRVEVEERKEDERFAAILHGDYNRNNVLFKYEEKTEQSEGDGIEKVADIKLIDFQELRYGSPAIDLSFFMYMNTPDSLRAKIWPEILKTYHSHMYRTLEQVLKANKTKSEEVNEIDKILKDYNFENFNAHFSRFAFYGVMICIHFLPWILCSEKECERLSYLFETNIHSEEFHKLSMEAGGDTVNERILEVIRHACKMGYMDNI